MKTVNPHLVEAALAGLTGLADNNEEGLNLYNSINPNNEAQVKQVIRE